VDDRHSQDDRKYVCVNCKDRFAENGYRLKRIENWYSEKNKCKCVLCKKRACAEIVELVKSK